MQKDLALRRMLPELHNRCLLRLQETNKQTADVSQAGLVRREWAGGGGGVRCGGVPHITLYAQHTFLRVSLSWLLTTCVCVHVHSLMHLDLPNDVLRIFFFFWGGGGFGTNIPTARTLESSSCHPWPQAVPKPTAMHLHTNLNPKP